MRKLIDKGLTDQSRVKRSKDVEVENFSEESHVYYGQVKSDERAIELSVDFTSGELGCSCEDFGYRKKICKHLIALLDRIADENIVDVDHLLRTIKDDLTFEPKYESVSEKFLSSGCEAFDEMFGGGIPKGTVSGVFSDFNVGKSILAHQLSANLWKKEGKETFYVDSEQGLLVDGEKYRDWFRDRYDIPDFNVEYRYATTVEKLLGMFGWEVTLKYSSVDREKGTGGKMDCILVPKGENRVKELFEEGKYGLCVIDSITEPVEGIMGSGQESFPGRFPLNARLIKSLREIAAEFTVPVFVTAHLSKGVRPTDVPKFKGGRAPGFGLKYWAYLGGGQRIGVESGSRWFKRYRAVGLPPRMGKDQQIGCVLRRNYGFV